MSQAPRFSSTITHLEWANVAKGIAILSILLIHVESGLVNAALTTRSHNWDIFHPLGYALRVPVFFFLSGFFAARSRKTLQQRIKYLSTCLIYPYVLWRPSS